MAMDTALVARLKAAAAIAALLGDVDRDIAWGLRPRGILTAIRLSDVWAGQEWRLTELDALEDPRVQFDCFGPDVTVCGDLRDAVLAEMQRTDEVTVGGMTFLPPCEVLGRSGPEFEEVEGTEGIFRAMLDLSFSIQPAS